MTSIIPNISPYRSALCPTGRMTRFPFGLSVPSHAPVALETSRRARAAAPRTHPWPCATPLVPISGPGLLNWLGVPISRRSSRKNLRTLTCASPLNYAVHPSARYLCSNPRTFTTCLGERGTVALLRCLHIVPLCLTAEIGTVPKNGQRFGFGVHSNTSQKESKKGALPGSSALVAAQLRQELPLPAKHRQFSRCDWWVALHPMTFADLMEKPFVSNMSKGAKPWATATNMCLGSV